MQSDAVLTPISPHHASTALDVSSVPLSLTIILHVAVDEAQGAAPSDLSCFGGKAIAFVALEAVTSVIGVDVDRRLLRLDRLDVAHRDVRVQLTEMQHGRDFRGLIGHLDDVAAWVKGSNIRLCFSGGIPIPVSETVKRSARSSPSSASRLTFRATSPFWVNLIALPMRLRTTWRSRLESPPRGNGAGSYATDKAQ